MSVNTQAQLDKARELWRSGSVPGARAAYRSILDDEPDCIEALLELGQIEREQGQLDTAVQLHRAAVGYAKTAVCWTALGRTLADAGQATQASDAYTAAIAADPDYAPAHLHLGELHGATEQFAKAQQSFETALRLDPNDAFAHHNLGICAQLRNDPESATQHFRAALQLSPRYWRSWQALGDLYRQAGRYEAALTCYERLVVLQPLADHLLRLGATRQLLGNYDAAIESYQRVLAEDAANEDAIYNLGTCYQATGHLDEAESLLKKVLTKNPDNPSAAAALAGVYDKRGDYAQGLALLRPYKDSAAANSEVWVSLGRLALNDNAAGTVVESIETALERQPFSPVDRSRVAFTAGALRDATGDYDRAFAHFELANKLKPHQYQRDVFERGVHQLIETFDASYADRYNRAASQDHRPVFVVGMPRCGSTLIERILTSHAQISSIGESPLLSGIAYKLGTPESPYPECLSHVSDAALLSAAQHYLAALPASADRVVDKMLSNLVHIGLIRLLFANARIIHCNRHPLDVALSCYSHDFAGTHVGFAYDLDDIAHYYRLYRRLMTHWQTLGTEQILEVAYEQVVTDTETVTRDMLTFLDVPFDANCLRFHEQDSLANTASYAQVRRPVYRESVGRYRHYEQQLQPIAMALSEYLEND